MLWITLYDLFKLFRAVLYFSSSVCTFSEVILDMTLFLNLTFVPVTFHDMFPICCPSGYKVNICRSYYRQIDKSFRLCGGLCGATWQTHSVSYKHRPCDLTHRWISRLSRTLNQKKVLRNCTLQKMKPVLRQVCFLHCEILNAVMQKKIIIIIKMFWLIYSFNL